jgi:hypothetical protein
MRAARIRHSGAPPSFADFVLVNIGLFVINWVTPGNWWFYWPLIGWGVGLGIHALVVFVFGGSGPWGQDWEERKIRAMMDRERGR